MDFYKLSKTVLFQGATPEETEQMLSCLKAGKRKYKKEEMIYRAGEVVSCVGVVLSGSVLIENDDIWGNRSVLERAGEGEIFAETYASISDQKMLVNVIAAEDTEILFLNVGKMLHICSNSCIFHNKLIEIFYRFPHRKISPCPEEFLTLPPNLSGEDCYPIYLIRQYYVTVKNLIYHLTASSLQTT